MLSLVRKQKKKRKTMKFNELFVKKERYVEVQWTAGNLGKKKKLTIFPGKEVGVD